MEASTQAMPHRPGVSVLLILALAVTALAIYAFVSASNTSVPPTGHVPDPTPEPLVLVGAGDIARCEADGDEATAALLDEVIAAHPRAIVFTTGDQVYPEATRDTYESCYDPSWGRHRDRTRPAVGNHDFGEPNGGGHHRYWGDAGGPFDLYYYEYTTGDWHVIVLNSECHRVGCALEDRDGEQAEWLRETLQSSSARCTIAVWHNPRWSSGRYEDGSDYQAFWELLYDGGAEIVLNGHEHFYERFAPLNPAGEVDTERGIQQFTIGTGGGELREPEDVQPHSELQATTYGVLQLRLFADRYEWEFLAAGDADVTDTGSRSCH